MKIVRYSAEGEVRCGIAEEDGTIRALAGSPFDSLDAGEAVAQLDQVQVLAPGCHAAHHRGRAQLRRTRGRGRKGAAD